MEYTRLGNHELTVCPCCDKLFQTVACDDFSSAMQSLDAMFQSHLVESPACAEYMRNLPSLEDVAETLRPHFAAAEAKRKQQTALKLLPCPFCGSEPELCFVYQSIGCENDSCPISPWTNHVGIGDPDDTSWIEEAARRWNTRDTLKNSEKIGS